MIDINVDENATSVEKITVNNRNISHSFGGSKTSFYANNQPGNLNTFATIKCYKSLPSITTLEAKARNIIKLHKTIFFNLSNLVNIDLRDNKLVKISKNFKVFKNLVSLKLDYNQISFIPLFIGDFTNLETFSISGNQLTYLPISIQNLSSLKYFSFSNNKIENIPIEIGQLNGLQSLYIDGNYFLKIPNTLCYLKKLKEFSFDWLEFVDPPYFRTIKDSVGKTIISIIQRLLEKMLKQGTLYCDFASFIDEVSPKRYNEDLISKGNTVSNPEEISDSIDNLKKNTVLSLDNNQANSNVRNSLVNNNSGSIPGKVLSSSSNTQSVSSQKLHQIFSAIENNYFGVTKSLLNSKLTEDYLLVKNQENKTAFYIAINSRNDDIINLFIEKFEELIKLNPVNTKFLNYTYLFKAIRSRNPELVKKLIDLGVGADSLDDQGRGAFHILFSVFNKQISKCILIGDYLLEHGAPINNLDSDNWAPVHLAARRGCKECLLWVILSNKKLRSENKDTFDLNLKGRNNWTPLHLAINSFRIEETLILLENGCDIFARNIEQKTPKKVSVGNFVFSKLLSHYEMIVLEQKYNSINVNTSFNNKCYTTIEDSNDLESLMSKEEKFNIEINKEKQIETKEDISENIPAITANKSNKVKNTNIQKKENNTNINIGSPTNSNSINKLHFRKGKTYDKFTNQSSTSLRNKKGQNKESKKPKLSNKNQVEVLKENKESKENKENKKTIENNSKELIRIPAEQTLCEISCRVNNDSISNINIQKDILLNSDSSAAEKYEALMFIKLNKNCDGNVIKSILENFDLESDLNLNIINDLCNFIKCNNYNACTTSLKKILERINNQKKKTLIKKELEETIKYLEIFKGLKDYNKKHIEKNQFNKKGPKVRSSSGQINIKVHEEGEEDDDENNYFIINNDGDLEDEEIENFENDYINFDEMKEIIKK